VSARRTVWLLLAAAVGCTNDPYPSRDQSEKIYYASFREAPKTLDPAVAYTTSAHAITGNVYEGLLEYHFLKRPYTLIPALAEEVPDPTRLEDGRDAYRFRIRKGVLYQEDACFELSGEGRRTREVVAADFAFEFARIADPTIASPVISNFSIISGFEAFSERPATLRSADPVFTDLPAHEQYARAGGIDGIRVHGDHEIEIVLAEAFPQLLYWLAMPFTAPVPWEAIAYYDGEEGREPFRDHPVGTGAYRLAVYEKQYRMLLERNDNWYGVLHPEWRAPGATYPLAREAGDRERGAFDPHYTGRALPFIERIEYRREREGIPAFGKFLQGYYDASGIINESFDKIVQEDRLSAEMADRGMRLEKTVGPSIYYLGFNMDDPVVGQPAGERGRKLRQAMSLVIDSREYSRLFMNGRGLPAQSPIPPAVYGYRADYQNPYRRVDVDLARRRIAEAGYPGGIDPETQRPLRLSLDTSDTSSAGRLRRQFFLDAWRLIGIDVVDQATNYNQFQEKVRNGAYQIFQWGWVADYPDPENFLFLLETSSGRSRSGGPNTANFSNRRYDGLFFDMKSRPNDVRRLELIGEMLEVLEEWRPWIELYHPEDYALYHPWLRNVKPFGMSYPMMKYKDVDPAQRAVLRREWNEPILWPAYALAAVAFLGLVPGVVTFYRERQ
jgi:ABC-type transport system substrate-binding protein